MNQKRGSLAWLMAGIAALSYVLLAGCASEPAGGDGSSVQLKAEEEQEMDGQAERLLLPNLDTAELDGESLKVVATTSIIGDVVSQVGRESIALTTLLGPGQDPHSYTAAARDLTAVAGADVIFVNGWELEEGLVGDLENIGEDVPIVPISANIEPLPFGDAEHDHTVDPHVWFSVGNVEKWVENAERVLSDLDPANGAVYEGNAAAYVDELEDLQAYAERELASIAEDKRFLVSNHDSFSYFAEAYGFEVLGTVIPAASTLAEPSASDLAELIAKMEAHGLCTIFTETAVSDTLAQTIAGELSGCEVVKVLPLYSGSIGPTGSGADSFSGMFRANVDSVVLGLR